MREYKLSKNISIKSTVEYEIDKIPEAYRAGNFILHNKIKDKEYIINESIKYYIDKFYPFASEQAVLRAIEKEMNNHSEDLQKACSGFFDFLVDKDILIPKNVEEKIISSDALYNVGEKIDDFTVQKILSENPHLDVYLAADPTGMPKVIKLINKSKVTDDEVYLDELADLEAEYALLQKVKNIPHICQGHYLSKTDQQAYIVIEYFEGRSLSKFLKNTPTLTEQDQFDLIEKLLEIFALIHQHKLVHGDIHSSNVLLNPEKEIRIIDLGLSHIAEFEYNEVPVFGGVSYYMPPERINISTHDKYLKEPDFFSDVYQIGLLIYLIVYNKLPFKGFIWEELAKNIKEEIVTYEEKSFLNNPVSNDLIKILKKCLDKAAENRYKNAGDILIDYRMHFNQNRPM